jgi:hypothetical protein
MKLRDFIKPSTVLKEGGNLEIGGNQAQHIDLQVHNRGYIVPILDTLLNAINNGYQQRYQEPLWNPKLLKSQQFLSGSSLHFFNTAGISDDDFQRVKPKVGDIDTQVNKSNEANLEQYLTGIQGKIVGNAKFLGFSRGNEQFSSLWELTDPPIKVQIDLEFVKFDDKGKSPTEWSQFSHSSSWDDIQEGIKGVFHKWLIQSFASLSEQQFLLRKLVGRGKARAEQDVPTTDNMVSFAVSSTEGGGLRAKYEPVLDEKGQPLVVNGLSVMRALPPEAYEQDLGKIFSSLFGARVNPVEMKKLQSKFWSFTGLVDVMNTIFDQAEKEKVVDAFIDKCFAPGAQGLYKNEPDRDLGEKNAAVNLMLSRLKVSGPTNLEQMRNTYKSNYRMTSEAMAENVDSPALDEAEGDAEQPAQVKAQLRKGMPHLHDLKPADLLDLLDEIHDGNGNFKLENIPLNVKVDGFGGRFGKNAEGKPFMGTSRTEPRYQAGFVAYHKQKGTTDPEVLGRAQLFDQLFNEMMNAIQLVDSKLGPDFLVNKQVTCEVLYLPFATETPEGKLKFVGIHYDKLPDGVHLALVPFRVVDATTGEDLPDSNKVIKELTSVGQSGSVMFIDNSLTQSEGLDVTALVPPLENIEQMKAMLASRKRDQAAEVKAALQPIAAALEKAIIEDPNIIGKDLLGQDYEGIVINSRLGPIKVTSQEQRDVITAKNAAKATARTERPRGEAKTAVVAIGSFIGHKGHEELFNYTINKAKEVGGDPYLFIGNAESKDDPIPPAVKVETWHKLYPEYAKNISTVQAGGQLIQKIKHELINPLPGKSPRYDNIVIMVGEDRAGMNMPNALMKAVNKFPGYEHVKVSLEVTPRGTGISGTALRNSLKNDPPEKALAVWSNAFDVQKLGVDWIKHLMDITRKGMGIQSTPAPVPQQPAPVAEQRLLNALIKPLHEGTSIDSTLRAVINDIGEPITNVYDTMKFQAKKYMENHGELGRGFRMVAAGVGGRWVQNMYVGRLQNELYDLCKYNTRRTVDLQEFLRGVETDGELEMKRSFGNIANSLPPILAKLGQQINAPQLTRNAQRWMQNKAEYERYLMDLEAEVDEPDDVPVRSKTPKSNAIGQQNAQVDSIINNVLGKVPKSIAGDIRNAIARAPNKLAALKAELDRHNINMAEDNDVMSRMARDLTGPGAPDAKRRAQRDQQRQQDRAQSDGRDHGPKWDVEEGEQDPQTELKMINQKLKDAYKRVRNNSSDSSASIGWYTSEVKALNARREELIKQLKQGVAEGSLEELANTSLKVKEPKNFVNTNDRKQVVYKVMKFKSGKDTYLINFTVKSAPAFGKKQNWNAVNVAFGVREEQDDYSFGDEIDTDLTAKNKNQFLIYSTVINAVRKFITEYNTEIDEIIMQGAGERQAAMYQRFFQSAGKYFPGWHHDGKHSLVRDVPRQTGKKVKEQGVAEAGSPAQQAAIAISMKKAGKKPKSEDISLNELSGYGGDKKYEHLGTHKRYEIYVTKQKFNNLYFIAIAENPRTLEAKFKAKGNTPQEAVNNLKLEIDKEIDVATKVSGQAILDFNVDFVKDILEMSSDVFYAKIVAGPRLVIAGPEMMKYPDIMRGEGFKPSTIRTYRGGEGTTKLPGVPLSAKSAASASLIANGRYVLGNEELDKDGNRVFELNFDSVVQASNDKMRLRAPALTVGTNRSQGVSEAPKSAAVRLGNAIKRVQGTTAASQARSVIPSSIPKPEPKPQEKSVGEEKQRLDPSCWKGYRKSGTKMKGDTRVNNCVKVSEDVENIMDALINKIIFNEAIQNNHR